MITYRFEDCNSEGLDNLKQQADARMAEVNQKGGN